MAKVLPVLVIAIVVVLAPTLLQVFKIKEIEISQGQDCLDQPAVQDLILTRNILTFKDSQISEQIKQKFTCVESITIKKTFPSKLTIEVQTSKPVVKIEQTDLYITESGLVTESAKDNQLPIVYLPVTLRPVTDQKITEHNVLTVLKITSLLEKTDFSAASVRFLGTTDIVFYSRQSVVAIFSQKKAPEEQVDSLQQVLAAAKIDATKIAKIDLRFDKPVIEYKK